MSDSPPVLSRLNLVVRDMTATLAFYRQLGLQIPDSAVWRTNSGAHVVNVSMPGGLDLGFNSVQLARSYNSGYRGPESGSPSVIDFSLDSREAVNNRNAKLIGAGYTGLEAPIDAFWGARFAIVEDPDGNHVGLTNPIDSARKTGAPSL